MRASAAQKIVYQSMSYGEIANQSLNRVPQVEIEKGFFHPTLLFPGLPQR